MIKVSVIVPVYNVGKFVGRCAQSLFNQTLKKDIEFIFVDDKTPDNSIEIIKSVLEQFPERANQVHFLVHDVNKGLAAARKTGIAFASGEFIAHCDSDDYVESDMYELLYMTANATRADMVICDYYVDFPNGKKKEVTQNITKIPSQVTVKLISGLIHNNVWSKFIRRAIYEKFDTLYEEGVNMWEDVSVVSRMAYYCKTITYLPKALYHYSQDNADAYTHKWKDGYTQNVLRAIEINKRFFIPRKIDVSPLITRGYYSILSHSPRNARKGMLQQFYEEEKIAQIDYSGFSTFGKLHAWCLFNSHNIWADMLSALKSWIKKALR